MMCCSPAAKARVAVRTELVPQTTTDLKTRFMVLPFFASALFFGPAAFQTRAASKCHCIVIALCDEAICEEIRLLTIGWPPVMFAYLIGVVRLLVRLTVPFEVEAIRWLLRLILDWDVPSP